MRMYNVYMYDDKHFLVYLSPASGFKKQQKPSRRFPGGLQLLKGARWSWPTKKILFVVKVDSRWLATQLPKGGWRIVLRAMSPTNTWEWRSNIDPFQVVCQSGSGVAFGDFVFSWKTSLPRKPQLSQPTAFFGGKWSNPPRSSLQEASTPTVHRNRWGWRQRLGWPMVRWAAARW